MFADALTRRRSQGTGVKLPRWCLWALVLIALVVVLAGIELRRHLVEQPRDTLVQQHLEEQASFYAGQVDAYMSDLLARLDTLATAPATVAAVKTPVPNRDGRWPEKARIPDVPDQRRQWHDKAEEQLPEARRIFLLSADLHPFPLPNNFVARRLAQRAATGESPPPTAARVEDWGLYLARQVRDGDRAVGVLLVEARLTGLRQQLTTKGKLPGRLELIQRVGTNRRGSLMSLGRAGETHRNASATTDIADWQVIFQTDRQQAEAIRPQQGIYMTIMAVLIALAAVASLWLVRHFRYVDQPQQPSGRRLDPRDDLFTETVASNRAADQPTSAAAPADPRETDSKPARDFPLQVFRDYDIRGRADSEIDGEFARQLGLVLGSRVLQQDGFELAVCCDGRISSPALKEALCEGILATGCDVLDLGRAPTPLLNFAIATADHIHSGVMVTASHNPAEDNGFKIILDNHVLSDRDILDLRDRMLNGETFSGEGELTRQDFHDRYIRTITEEVLASTELRVVVDCGNGVTGEFAPDLIREMGCLVTELFTEVDGHFPNHPPDPTIPANLDSLIETVTREGADLGLALDGDGDRLVAVTGSGRIVWPDELLMIFARDVATRNPGGDIVFDVKCTRRLGDLISNYGGRPVMWKTGHAHIRNRVQGSKAPLGGEFSGHIVFNDRWYGFDDGLYAAARLIELIGFREQSLDDMIAAFPPAFSTPEIRLPVDELRKRGMLEELQAGFAADNARIVTLDGLRVEYESGWGLIRASNTAAALTLRFEADSEAALAEIQDHFRDQLRKLLPDLRIEF